MVFSIHEITRIIAHDVVKHNNAEPNFIPPIMSEELFDCSDLEKQQLIINRLTETLGKSSKCVDVEVQTPNTFNIISSLIDAEDTIFISYTQELSELLSNAQTGGSINSGSALFMQGLCNYDGQTARFIAIIKADPDKALCKRVINGSIIMELINELFLSSSQRMIKVALFVETERISNKASSTQPRDPEDFVIKVYDHLMSNLGDHDAAKYFYQGFLGCKMASNAARISKKFFQVSDQFIMNNARISQKDREIYRGNLIAYMRGEVNNIVAKEVADFIFPENLRDAYVEECIHNEVGTAFIKDNSLIKRKLVKRTIRFDSNVILYIPGSMTRDQIEISDPDSMGWTTIKIKGQITS